MQARAEAQRMLAVVQHHAYSESAFPPSLNLRRPRKSVVVTVAAAFTSTPATCRHRVR